MEKGSEKVKFPIDLSIFHEHVKLSLGHILDKVSFRNF